MKKIYFFLKYLKRFFQARKQYDNIVFTSATKIESPIDTLNKCRYFIENKKKGGYFRFGDGDVNLLEGKDELMQFGNKKISIEMMEAFSLSDNLAIKGLPLHSEKFGIEIGMKPGLHSSSDEWAENILKRCFQFFIGNKIYSSVALPYVAVFNYDFTISFLKLINKSKPIFVGNKNIPDNIIKKMFNNNVHIKTPEKNSYNEIDNIEKEVLLKIKQRANDFELIVVAMGCSGRILQKRLLLNNINCFIFDFGSLMDAFCGWKTREWMNLINVPSNYFDNMLDDINK